MWKTINEMLKAGAIEHSTSQWNHRYVLVPKTDGSRRMTLDLRRFNVICRPLGVNSPKVEDVLEDIYGSNYFASMDCSTSFHTLPLAKECQHMLAFQFDNQKYQYKTCAQGLAGSAAAFQKFMTGLVGDLEYNGINSFVDDMMAHQ